jgi:hypothetical protein
VSDSFTSDNFFVFCPIVHSCCWVTFFATKQMQTDSNHYLQPVIMPSALPTATNPVGQRQTQLQNTQMVHTNGAQQQQQAFHQGAAPSLGAPMQQMQQPQMQQSQMQQSQMQQPQNQQVERAMGPMTLPASRPSISNADFQAFAKQHRPPEHVSLGGLPYRSASLLSSTAPSATSTNPVIATQLHKQPQIGVALQEIVHPLTVGLSVAALSSLIFIASPGIAFTRVKDLDKPTERSRDWFKIAFVSSLVGAGTGVGLALTRRFV